MNARVKGTDEPFRKVQGIILAGQEDIALKPECVEFEPDYNYWERLRHQAAIAVLQGYASIRNNMEIPEESLARWSISLADELIEQLKNGTLDSKR